ncbi:MAG: hypothetical protein EKK41_26350, partial [Hyphomicrobiales bacterium]
MTFAARHDKPTLRARTLAPRGRSGRHRALASWSGVETATILVFAVISTPVVAIFVGPEQLGKAAIALGLIGIVEIICCTGWHDALVRAPSLHTRLIDSANTVICLAATVAMLLLAAASAPLAAVFHDDGLRPLLIAAALALPLSAATTVPSAILARKLRAKSISLRWVVHRAAALIVTLGLAMAGAGAMSIVLGALAANLASVMVLFSLLRRTPRFIWRWAILRNELRPVLRYVGGISAETLLSTGMIKTFNILVGWLYGAVGAGLFQLSQRIVDETATVFQTLIARYALAHFAELSRNGRDPTATLLVGTTLTAYIALPVFAALAVCADDVVHLVFGEAWKGAAGMLRFCAIGWMLAFPVQLAMPFVRAAGRQARLTLYAAASALIAVAALFALQPLGLSSVGAAWAARHLPAIPFAMVTTSLLLGV